MIRHLVARLLQSIGCTVTLEGDVITASRGGSRLVLGFPSKESLEDVQEQIAQKGGNAVLIPLFDEYTSESGQVRFMDREQLEEDILDVVLGKRSPHETSLGSLVKECLGEGGALKEATIRPTLTREEVIEIGTKTVDSFNYILDLVPYFVFEYKTMVEENGEIRESCGTIGVNALTSSSEVWRGTLDIVDGLEYFDRKLEPRIDEKEAFRIAQKHAVELGAVVTESVRERGDATIEEMKTLRPEKEDVHLEGKGILYLPVWCVEGSKGSIIINAGTGKILKEDIYS